MDFKDQLKQLSDRVIKLKEQTLTEEATKNAFIMPFIQVLGYDVFNPTEVVPEFIADIGVKKGEKVDYAILIDNSPVILVECKHWKQNLDLHDNQLLRYFNVTKAKFGILTNGIKYRFYTDLVEPNVMDTTPFLEFDLMDMKENQVEELKKFHKSYFNIEMILNSASELKFTNEIKTILANEFKAPSEEFVRFFAQKVYPKNNKSKNVTAKVLEQFTELVKKSIQHLISDIITERLKSAIDKENESIAMAINDIPTPESAPVEKERNVETTAEEMEGYFVVKSILRTVVASNRLVFRDAQSYFSILLDDNNRKTICRFYFNGNKKYVGTFDAAKKETRNEIQKLDDIYDLADAFKATVESYISSDKA